MQPNFEVTPEERLTVGRIVQRAAKMFPDWDKTSLAMDLVATHNHACRLRLTDLLEADDFNFAHDITGIVYNLDRYELTFKNCFLPRFTAVWR